MFDKLFDFITLIWTELKPYYVVTEMEAACVLRFGKFNRTSDAGLYWKIPFADIIYTYHAKTQTSHLSPQTLTTSDSKSIVLRVIVRYKVSDIRLYVTQVWDAHEAVMNVIQGIVADLIKDKTWEEVRNGKEGSYIEDLALELSNQTLSEWGIEVENIAFSDLGELRTIRLLKE